MISFQSYVGSAYSSHPVRWIETPEAARSRYVVDQIPEKPVEKVTDPDIGKPQSASGDILDLSPETKKALELSRSDTKIELENGKTNTGKEKQLTAGSTEISPTGAELTPEEQQRVAELKAKDQEIRTHEMAHVIAGGQHVTSGPSYEYEIGPDGKGYAVSGSVGIDTSPVKGDPVATIAKMQTVVAAAMAPATPSGQDHKVAAAARQAEAKARAELAQSRTEQPEEHEEQPANESIAAFSVVRPADKIAANSSPSESNSIEDSVMPSLVQTTQPKTNSTFTPGSAYRAQSTMSLSSPSFSAFA